MGGISGNYSNIIIYDEEKRYYYLNPQKNRPLLDDEIRNMHIAVMDQLRRSVQQITGKVAVPLQKNSTTTPSTDHYKVSVPSGMTGGQSNNFVVTGGYGINNPAVLFVNGYYIFIEGDIEYLDQMYGSGNIDLSTEVDKSKTLTSIPDLTTPVEDRRDIVYVDLHFKESTAASGSDESVYYDSGILDPRVGTPTANRLRAVIDIRVLEGFTGAIDKNIFQNFLDGNYHLDSGVNESDVPTDNHYRVPIAAIYRETGDDIIDSDKIIDLLSVYDKRVLTLEELSYMSLHGGYGESAVFELNGAFTGFNPQFPDAKVDEGAFATGLNQGFSSDALNSNAVTPRSVDNDGKFLLGSLQVGVETGINTYPITAETGPEELNGGELMSHQASFQHAQIGYGRGITGNREYNDGISVHMQGLTGISLNLQNKGITGVAGLSMHNLSGDTGVYTQFIEAENYFVIDFKGRMGYNTATPGWDNFPAYWNVSRYPDPVNVVIDVNDSQRIRKHLFIDQDTYTQGDLYGRTWSIPQIVDQENKAYFGFTGVPAYGVIGSSASVMVKPGIATQGLSGTEDYRGYTGISGFYESYDRDGGRIFTIGDLGPEFDRVVKTLYGTGLMPLFYSDTSFKYLATLGEITDGDQVSVTVDFLVGGDQALSFGISGATYALAIESLRSQLQTALQNAVSSPDITVSILEDPYDEALSLAQRLKNDGKIIIKDKLSEIQSIVSFRVTRGAFYDDVTWTESNYYGSGNYGGDTQDFKFAKLDLGEAADAWLFNGDVFFNGDGLLNRVTFSPNVIFRDDVFVYGDLFANSLKFERATLNYLTANQKIDALNYVNIGSGFDENDLPLGGLTIGVGPSGNVDLLNMQNSTYSSLWLYINGDAKAENFLADFCGTTGNVLTVLGNSFPRSNDTYNDVYFKIGGSYTDTTNPYGLHLIDARSGVSVTQNQGFRTLKMDYGDGNGNFGQLNVDLRGNLTVNNNIAASTITAGRTTAVTNYDLFVDNDARIEGTLEVSNLRFIGSGTPGELDEITEPQNVIIYKDGTPTVDNKPNGILRTKEFSVDQKVVLNNTVLGYNDASVIGSVTDPVQQDILRVNHILNGSGGNLPVWVKDTMTYAADDFTEYGTTSLDADTISAQVSSDSPDFRYNLDKITLATLGTIKMRYIGRIEVSAVGTSTIEDFVQTYTFETPYFKDRDQGSIVNWFAGDQTTVSNNFIATVDLSLIDDKKAFWNSGKTALTGAPQIYNINQPIWFYIPLNSWTHYKVYEGGDTEDTTGYYTVYLANKWEHILQDQNVLNMNRLVSLTSNVVTNCNWKIGVFPRFKRVTKTTVDVSEDQYDAEWELNLIAFTEGTGTSSDMHGRMFINHF